MHVEHSESFFKLDGPVNGTEQWKLFNLSEVQSLYLNELRLSNVICLR